MIDKERDKEWWDGGMEAQNGKRGGRRGGQGATRVGIVAYPTLALSSWLVPVQAEDMYWPYPGGSWK